MYTHVHMHARMHAYRHNCAHTCMTIQIYTDTHMHEHIYRDAQTQTHAYTHTHMHTHTHTHTHIQNHVSSCFFKNLGWPSGAMSNFFLCLCFTLFLWIVYEWTSCLLGFVPISGLGRLECILLKSFFQSLEYGCTLVDDLFDLFFSPDGKRVFCFLLKNGHCFSQPINWAFSTDHWSFCFASVCVPAFFECEGLYITWIQNDKQKARQYGSTSLCCWCSWLSVQMLQKYSTCWFCC